MEEIKAGDIMLGNYIQSPYGNYPIAEIGYKDDDAYIRQKDCHAGYYLSYCRPIPLTEDILLKAGAKRLEENKVAIMLNDPSTHLILMNIGTHWYPQIEQTGESVSDGVNTVHLNFIDYAHQAQILFKALTGNDLKI